MKMKKFLSLLLALTMVLGTLPLPAMAEEEGPACVCEALCTEEAKNTDCPVCGAENANLTKCAKYATPAEKPTEPVTEPPTEKPTEPATEPPTEKRTEPVTEPPTEKPTEPAAEPPTEKPTEPATEPPTEKPTEPATEPETEPEAQVKTITAWVWNDDYEIIEDGGIGLIWDTVSWEALAEMLPGITATVDGTEEVLALTWSCADVKDGTLTKGTHTLTAALPEGYALGEGVPALTLILEMGGGMPLAGEDSAFEVTGTEGVHYEFGHDNGRNVLFIKKDATISMKPCMTQETKYGIRAEGSINVTLKDVNIDVGATGNGAFVVWGGCTLTLEGDNYLTSGGNFAGLQVTSGNYLTIRGNGSLTARGTTGIGSGYNTSCGNITITGGTVNATGTFRKGTGIGGNLYGSGGNIVISGGIVNASGSYGYDIGCGADGRADNYFSTGEDGTAFIKGVIHSRNDPNTWYGIILNGGNGLVRGQQTLPVNVDIRNNEKLEIVAGSSLTIPGGKVLTISGTVIKNGTLTIDSAECLAGTGTLVGDGAYYINTPGFAVPEGLTYTGADQTAAAMAQIGLTGETVIMGQTFVCTEYDESEWSYELSPSVVKNAGTYTVAFKRNGTTVETKHFTVEKAELTPSLTGSHTKTYDGGTACDGTGLTIDLAGKIATDDVSATAAYTYDSRNAGENKTVTASNIQLSGAAAENYALSTDTATAAGAITKKTITVTGNGTVTVRKPYDGNTDPGDLTGALEISGVVGADNVTVTAVPGAYADANVEADKTVTLTLSLDGADKNNYQLAQTIYDFAGAEITQATNGWKVQPTIENWTYGETAKTPSAEAEFGMTQFAYCTKNEDGSYTELTGVPTGVGTYYLKATVAATGNYTGLEKYVQFTIGKGTPSVTPPTAASDLVYNGTAQTLIKAGSTSGGQMQYSLNGTTYSADLPAATNAGAYTVWYKVLGGGNYKDAVPQSIPVTIGQKEVGLTWTASDLTYDGTAKAPTATATGIIGSDTVNVTVGLAEGDNTNVTEAGFKYQAVSLTNGNYKLPQNVDSPVYQITPKSVTISNLTAENKTYDSNTDATISGTAFVDGAVASDDVTVTMGKATFDTKDVGTNKTVTGTDFSLEGTDAGNYNLTVQPTWTANITPSTITVTGNGDVAVTRAYDGNTDPGNLTGALEISGVVGTENVTVIATPGAYADANAGTGKTVTLTLHLDGTDKDNYQLAHTTYDFTGATITQATNAWTTQPAISGWTYGDLAESPVGAARFGAVQFTYCDKDKQNPSATALTDAGDYFLKAMVAGNDNYTGLETYVPFTIAKADPVVTWPANLSGDAGKKLSTVTLLQGFTWDALDTVITYGEHEYPMTYTPADTANYNVLTANVKVTGNDVTAPTAQVTIATNRWNHFLNNVTFDLFFKATQSVTITASDTESGVDSISYHLAASALTENAVKALPAASWTAYTGSFHIDPNHTYVVYVKVTDKAQNTVFISSDGVVLDSIAPVIEGIENGKSYKESVTFTAKDAYLDTVMVDGKAVTLTDGKYTITADNKEHTIVATDKAGNVTQYKVTVLKVYTVTYKADGKVVETQKVAYGQDATPPKVPAKSGYTGKWDKDGKNITEDTVITAKYTQTFSGWWTNPKTGDSMRFVFVVFVASLVGLCGMGGYSIWKKRKK